MSNNEEMRRRLLAVMKRHPNVDYNRMAQHEDMGFQQHEKEAVSKHASPQEQIAHTIAAKKEVNEQIKNLHKTAKKTGHNEFADDLEREFF